MIWSHVIAFYLNGIWQEQSDLSIFAHMYLILWGENNASPVDWIIVLIYPILGKDLSSGVEIDFREIVIK